VKGRVDCFGLAEGKYFVFIESFRSFVLKNAKSRPQTTTNYFLTIDMAKDLSIVERNEKAK